MGNLITNGFFKVILGILAIFSGGLLLIIGFFLTLYLLTPHFIIGFIVLVYLLRKIGSQELSPFKKWIYVIGIYGAINLLPGIFLARGFVPEIHEATSPLAVGLGWPLPLIEMCIPCLTQHPFSLGNFQIASSSIYLNTFIYLLSLPVTIVILEDQIAKKDQLDKLRVTNASQSKVSLIFLLLILFIALGFLVYTFYQMSHYR